MTIKEIAAIAGVSISTVSKIINGKDSNIKPETKERVLKVVKEYNFTPYASIKSQAPGKRFILGLLLRDMPSSALLINGILDHAQENGYSLLLYSSSGDSEKELKNISSLCQKHVDGVLWEPVSSSSLTHQKYFDELNIPVLLFNCAHEDSCNLNFKKMGFEAASRLIQLGHTKIGCLLNEASPYAQAIADGFRQCIFENTISFSNDMILSPSDSLIHTRAAANSFTGILCTDYTDAVRLYGALSELKIQVPYELSILSFIHDPSQCSDFPRLSGIVVPYYQFGKRLCERIIKICEGQTISEFDFNSNCTVTSNISLEIPYTSKKQKIVVVGSINMDTILNVEKLPHIGETVSTTMCSTYVGGKGTNQSVGVSKLGHKVTLIGKIGNDMDGAYICSCMKEHEVDTSGIITAEDSVTGKAYIHVQSDGDSTISIYAGANNILNRKDIYSMEYLFENTGFCLMQTEIPMSAIRQAAALAKKHQVTTILKPSACSFLDDELLANIDILIPNHMELNTICPSKEDLPRQAEYFLDRGVKTVIVTLGAGGCYMKSKDSEQHFPAANFTAIDNTGASDAFISALGSYLLFGYSMEKAIRIATYAAGFCVSRMGVIPALIDKNSLEIYIKSVEPDLLWNNT